MKLIFAALILVASSVHLYAAPITPNLSAVRPGPIAVESSDQSLRVTWNDAAQHQWQTVFSLDSTKPLITAISVDGRTIVTLARPWFRCTTGKRVGGWDAFFDFPPANPAGTRQFLQEFHPTTATAQTVGNRVEVTFDGLNIGIFSGSLKYAFYPGTPLIQQAAILSTKEPDTAYYYDAGLQMTADQDRTVGGNMASHISYYDTEGKLREITPPYRSDRHSLAVHYRAIAAKMGSGSIAVFPPPHRYLFARDYTTNQGYMWFSSWRGLVGLGIHQYPDDNTLIDPWINAPPGTNQEMSLSFSRRRRRERNSQERSRLHAQRSLCSSRRLCHLRTALASRLHRAGHGERSRLAATLQTRHAISRHRLRHDHGLPRRWSRRRSH